MMILSGYSSIAPVVASTKNPAPRVKILKSQYALDSDELYANLNTLADNIKIGKDELPSAKKYSNPEYKLTQDDKIKSGGFQDLF